LYSYSHILIGARAEAQRADASVRPLLSRIIELQSNVPSHAAHCTLSVSAYPKVKALTPDAEAFKRHLRDVIHTLNDFGSDTIPHPDILEHQIADNLATFATEVPHRPAECIQKAMETGLSPDVATLALWAAFSPFYAHACEKWFNSDEVSTWTKGSCPICGARPHVSKLREEDGARILECWLCGASWQFPRLQCPYCDNTDQQSLGFFYIEEDKSLRVHFCRRCGSYLKVADVRQLKRDPVLSIYNLATLHYDAAAVTEGFKAGSGLSWVSP